MRCLVTAGPTYEPLDQVRRLTNFSTGALGSALANLLAERGHDVTLLKGSYATTPIQPKAQRVEIFSTTSDLSRRLAALAGEKIEAVFHAAAVSDFSFGKIFAQSARGNLREITSGKFSTRDGPLLAELVPTPKLLGQMRGWFPTALICGWKYEVEGDRASVAEKGRLQISENQTNACVINGPAYGEGFGFVSAAGTKHMGDSGELCRFLEGWARGI